MSVEMECGCCEYTHKIHGTVELNDEDERRLLSLCPECGEAIRFFVRAEILGKQDQPKDAE